MHADEGLAGRIGSPADVKALDASQLAPLCADIRRTLVDYGKRHGGHIGSNLAVVELTVALHRVFDSPRDAIIFDVSHQSYTHKMLTGRAPAFLDPALAGSVTGFTNPGESPHDLFALGHTGTSVSLACGMARARDMGAIPAGGPGSGDVIAVIGDGALSSSVALEGMSDAAELGGNLIVIVNDNEMSIAENHGGLYASLARLRESGGREGPNPFRALGMDYRYLEHGNDVDELVPVLEEVRDVDHPLVLHIHTTKGLGLDEEDAAAGVLPGRHESNHWQNPLSAADAPLKARKVYGRMAMEALGRRFPDEPGLVVISPATPGSNGITPEFRVRAGRHYVDTGIAEDHAAAFAAGLARAGATPVLATSSTFFQRAYDEIHEELALNGLPVTLLVFAAGFSSTDHTHSGIFDIPMLASIPGLTYLAPTSGGDLLDMLDWSTRSRDHGPVAIRIPGDDVLAADRDRARRSGTVAVADALSATGAEASSEAPGPLIPNPVPGVHGHDAAQSNPFLRYRIDRRGRDVALIGLGTMLPLAESCADALGHATDDRLQATVVDPRQCSLLDEAALARLGANHRLIVTLEDGQRDGGWGQRIAAYYAAGLKDTESGSAESRKTGSGRPSSPRVICLGADAEYADRVPMDELRARYGLTIESIIPRILRILSEGIPQGTR